MTIKRQQFQVIRALHKGPKTVWELIKEIDGTIKTLYANLKELQERDIIAYDNFTFSLKDKEKYASICRESFEQEFKQYAQICKDRPSSKMEYFQAEMREEDVFKRMQTMYDRGDVAEKEIFILGDDDLLSIALALTKLPKRIVVLEIDKRITDFIQKVSDSMQLGITVINGSATKPLPQELQGTFDVFVTDPVETPKGFTAFISRCVQALKHPGSGYFGLTDLECSPQSWHSIQKDLNSMKLIITDVIRKFSFYPEDLDSEEVQHYEELRLFKEAPFPLKHPNTDWYNSNFIRVQTVDTPVVPEVEFDDAIYQGADVMTTR